VSACKKGSQICDQNTQVLLLWLCHRAGCSACWCEAKRTFCLVADARAQSPCAYLITPTGHFPHLHFGHQMPLRQASLQLQQLSIGTGLIGAGVNALVHRPAVWEPAFPLHGSIHPTAVLAVPVYDVRLLGPVWVALRPLCIL